MYYSCEANNVCLQVAFLKLSESDTARKDFLLVWFDASCGPKILKILQVLSIIVKVTGTCSSTVRAWTVEQKQLYFQDIYTFPKKKKKNLCKLKNKANLNSSLRDSNAAGYSCVPERISGINQRR